MEPRQSVSRDPAFHSGIVEIQRIIDGVCDFGNNIVCSWKGDVRLEWHMNTYPDWFLT